VSVEITGIAAVGDVLAGKYRVDKILGIGGMGMVVAATHLELDQRVALKFMLPSSHESPDIAARFTREARAAGRLNSDHVCRVIDVGRFDGGVPYIVMEYLQGEDLGALLRRRGPLRVSDAVGYILQAIEGIAEAHANGIIHRDLKPDNLFLHKRNDGGTIVKVLDFGISKAKAVGVSTRTGDIFGSPAYMAPEQMESSRSVDHRADMWSLGVVLYQLVVGKPPFQAESLPLLCMSVVNDEPRPMSEIRGDLPDGFEAVVMKCLRKDPDERHADVGELAHALARFGPVNATTSASRIQIVLRRIHADSASVISTEFSTVERVDGEGPPAARPSPALHASALHDAPALRVSARDAARVAGGAAVVLGQPRSSQPGALRSRRLAGALIAAIAVVSVAIVVVWRSGASDRGASRGPRALADPAPAGAAPLAAPAAGAPAARAPSPIVEPIEPIAAPTPSEPTPSGEPAPSGGEPSSAASTASAASAASAPIADDRPSAPPRPELKKRKPHRPTGTASARGRGGASSAADAKAADARAGSNAGSAVPDDDKWMHMTHDDKKP
jgi:eukaryotic-like serine/threonine-protein kinase